MRHKCFVLGILALGLSALAVSASAASTHSVGGALPDSTPTRDDPPRAVWFESDLPTDFVLAALNGRLLMFGEGVATLIADVPHADAPDTGLALLLASGDSPPGPVKPTRYGQPAATYADNSPVDTAALIFYASWDTH